MATPRCSDDLLHFFGARSRVPLLPSLRFPPLRPRHCCHGQSLWVASLLGSEIRSLAAQGPFAASSNSHLSALARLGFVQPNLRDENANSHPRAAPVVFHHLDGFLLLDLATLLQIAADPGVQLVSFCRETEFPALHLLPFEAFPPPTATATETNPGLRGPASPIGAFSAPPVHREPCPLTLSLPLAIRDGKPPHPSIESRGLRALLHRRVRCALGRFQPFTPGAPLGLSDSPAPLFPSRRPATASREGADG
jgi:hypothetical protein